MKTKIHFFIRKGITYSVGSGGWIIEDNLPFSFCERLNTKNFSKLDAISVDTLMKYLKIFFGKYTKGTVEAISPRK